LKIYNNQEIHIKTVPIKYESVIDRITFSDKKKRLSNRDRLFLEGELVRDNLKAGNRIEKLTAERLYGAIADDCKQINIRNEEHPRYELWFNNGEKIHCSCALFKFGSGEIINSLH